MTAIMIKKWEEKRRKKSILRYEENRQEKKDKSVEERGSNCFGAA